MLIRQHGRLGPPGLLGRWLRRRGIPAVVFPTQLDVPAPDPRAFAFVASLGAAASVSEVNSPTVAEELRYLDRAVGADVPVLGLCFGGQALAVVLGGRVERMAEPELGWREIDTCRPDLVPSGPWLEWHWDRFVPPDTADVIATTRAATQAFRVDRHLGVQFHPESTIDMVLGWARQDRERLDGDPLLDRATGQLEADRHLQACATRSAFRLFDAFWPTSP